MHEAKSQLSRLVAQAVCERATIVSADAVFDACALTRIC